ncbi:HNH endonuclease [Corynebacterium phoceense]
MPWLRIGDNITTHPYISKLLSATALDHQQKNEAFGVLIFLAVSSAAHLTDGIVEYGLLSQVAPGRERIVLDYLVKAEIASEVKVEGRAKIRLIADDEEFIHARRREEVEQDRRRARDKRTPGLLASVRLRDGDACRWCGNSVSWTNRAGNRAATYDSLTNHQDSTVDTLVISCKTCNSKRGAGKDLQLKPEPLNPIYGEKTVAFINEDEWCKANGIHVELTSPTLPLESSSPVVEPRVAGSAPVAADRLAGAPGDEDQEEEPEWLTMPLDQIRNVSDPVVEPRVVGSAPVAADRLAGALGSAHTAPKQPASLHAADTSGSANAAARPADGAQRKEPAIAVKDEPPGHQGSSDLGRDPDRKGDGTGNVGSGRVGTGRARQAEACPRPARRKRRRGSRGGKKKGDNGGR